MGMQDIGIDLGTTFSVIAIKGRVDLPGGWGGTYIEECDVTIILSPLGEATFPSVYWEEPGDPGKYIVGSDAKQKAQEGESPIMFSKRSIGTTERLRMHDRDLTAREVAARILTYLKGCAEQALGHPVRRAVVTHPAYFDPNQVEETRQAAIDAGLDMSRPEQMMKEPEAAAHAYVQGNSKDPLRVMTYDLGGGTFDVAVLERREGVISTKAFDGDHLLGGYNFDRELIRWILDRVREKLRAAGRTLPPHDEADPQHRARHARLLQLAEKVKLALNDLHGGKVACPIKGQDILTDSEGRPIQIIEKITRDEYAQLIKDHLDKSIECCRKALGKAGVGKEDLDAILLVGGSSYGKWVQDAVGAAFGIERLLFNPDLCVAAGAALRAAELPEVTSSGDLSVELEVPPESPLPEVQVRGRIRSAGDGAALGAASKDLKVLLTTPDGKTHATAPNDAGEFLFPDVPLLEEGPTPFQVQVTDRHGLARWKGDVAVRYNPAGGGTKLVPRLPKTLYLEAREGRVNMAEEDVDLPTKFRGTFVRLHSDSVLAIPVFQEEDRIGTIRVENIPPDAGAGCDVLIEGEITTRCEIRGTAAVLGKTGAPVVECPVRIKFPPVSVPELHELAARFRELRGEVDEQIHNERDEQRRTRLGMRGKKLVETLERLTTEDRPDRQEIHRAVKELDRMLHPPRVDLTPSRDQFLDLLDACRDALPSSGSDPQAEPLRKQLHDIEAAANRAYLARNQRQWAQEYEKLQALLRRLKRGGPPVVLPPTPLLKDVFRDEVDKHRLRLNEVRQAAAADPRYEAVLKGRCDAIEAKLAAMDKAIDQVDDQLPSDQGRAKLQLILRGREKTPIAEQIEETLWDVKPA
ncbi:MAG: Hsp70 family protein [Planctomycetes bacterium]|nr:Hsp70 family protein [Planctomycetota bacterium]